MAWIFSVGKRIAYRRKIARAAPGSGRPSRIKGDKNDGKYRKYYSWDHDPVCGDDTWGCVRIFYEEGNPSECGKRSSGLCVRCHGGGIRVVTSDPVHESFRGSGTSGVSACGDRILLRHPVPAVP